MANWKLVASHYLHLEDQSYWEFKSTDRTTGRVKIDRIPVPTLLNPEDPADWTRLIRSATDGIVDKGEGIIIVSDGVEPMPGAKVFKGDPTPDMVPMDKDAEKKSAAHSNQWKHPIESLETTYADRMLQDLNKSIEEVKTTAAPVKLEGMEALMTAMTAMMQQNQQLLEMIANQKTAPAAARRV